MLHLVVQALAALPGEEQHVTSAPSFAGRLRRSLERVVHPLRELVNLRGTQNFKKEWGRWNGGKQPTPAQVRNDDFERESWKIHNAINLPDPDRWHTKHASADGLSQKHSLLRGENVSTVGLSFDASDRFIVQVSSGAIAMYDQRGHHELYRASTDKFFGMGAGQRGADTPCAEHRTAGSSWTAFDTYERRWLVFARGFYARQKLTGPYYICIAVSSGQDPVPTAQPGGGWSFHTLGTEKHAVASLRAAIWSREASRPHTLPCPCPPWPAPSGLTAWPPATLPRTYLACALRRHMRPTPIARAAGVRHGRHDAGTLARRLVRPCRPRRRQGARTRLGAAEDCAVRADVLSSTYDLGEF